MSILNLAAVDRANRIYRGGQPAGDADYSFLRDLGIELIIKLNAHNATLQEEIAQTGFEWFYAPMSPVEQILTEPDLDGVSGAVAAIRPGTFIHCEHGQDRTGLVVALYRIQQGWTREEARKEMLARGFHTILLGLDKAWEDLSQPTNA